ncbi:MAG: pitrilysin family protein [Gemmatimonadota bacterium]|nr:pitrilysin family protein [Gemmatimonadota bacterium]
MNRGSGAAVADSRAATPGRPVSCGCARRRIRAVTAAVALLIPVGHATAQQPVRERIASLEFPRLGFTPTQPREETVRGVTVYFLPNDELPLVTFYAVFKGGVGHLPRDYLAAASAMPTLLRGGGTASMPPDSVDLRIESLALAMSFGQGGGSASSWVNSLAEHLDEAVTLWAEMLREPRFDSAQVEQWRGAELERVRRRGDDPASLAYTRFNRIMYGDHPIGWEMSPGDLDPADVAEEKLRHVHEAQFCPGNMVLGVAGDVDWERAEALLEDVLSDWPPCSGNLREYPVPDIRRDPGVFVIHKPIEQSVVIAAHSSSLRQGDTPAYFASRIGNSILGASGLSSRLNTEVRTREGLAYGASSLWTTSRRNDGLIGAVTRTRPGSTLAAARLLLEVLGSMRDAEPSDDEVARVVDQAVNGFVFNFGTPLQVVSRSMTYRTLDLPDDWLERYLRGIQRVTPGAVHDVFRDQLDPGRMTILLVGDTTRFDGSPTELGTVTILEEDPPPPPPDPSPPRGSPRSPG